MKGSYHHIDASRRDFSDRFYIGQERHMDNKHKPVSLILLLIDRGGRS
jgi:hypothetical protein